MKVFATLLLAAILSTSSGCMFIEAGLRSGDDHRRRGNYPSKSYGQHLLDASVGVDTRKRPRRPKRTRVVVCHCHGPCHHHG